MLKVDLVAAVRGLRILFSDVSMTADAGDFVHIAGPNGAGKSTLLRMLAGLTRPYDGTITWPDQTDLARSIHYLGHANGLKPTDTPERYLRFWTKFSGAPTSHIAEALDRCGVRPLENIPIRVLSAGQKRRVALSRLFADPKPVWLLDEPTAALDQSGQDWFWSEVKQHLDGGGLAIFVLHEQPQVPPSRIVDLSEMSR